MSSDFSLNDFTLSSSQVSNEIEVMHALKALETRAYDSGATVRFQDVDYNVLTFKQQIKIDLGERL